jgi:hypothetical protein
VPVLPHQPLRVYSLIPSCLIGNSSSKVTELTVELDTAQLRSGPLGPLQNTSTTQAAPPPATNAGKRKREQDTEKSIKKGDNHFVAIEVNIILTSAIVKLAPKVAATKTPGRKAAAPKVARATGTRASARISNKAIAKNSK